MKDYLNSLNSINDTVSLKHWNSGVNVDMLLMALKDVNKARPYPSTIQIPSKSGSVYIKVENIVRAEAEGSYCKVFTDNGNVHIMSNNLKFLEKQLDPRLYFRCHHSHVVNMAKIKEVVTEAGAYIIMEDNSEVCISKRKKNDFFHAMKQFVYA